MGHAIEINAIAPGGPNGVRLTARWSWPGDLFSREKIEELAGIWVNLLTAFARRGEEPGVGGFSPSDLPLLDLTQSEIESLEAAEPLEGILPLSPLQEGFLVHALNKDAEIDPCIVQMSIELKGPLDIPVLQHSLEARSKRHTNLRRDLRKTA